MRIKTGPFCKRPRIRDRRGILLAWLAALLVWHALAGCSEKKVQSIAREAVPVVVGTVTSRDVPLQVSAIGTAEAYSTVAVKSQVTGELKEIHFSEGREVKQDSLLFSIDSRSFEADLRRAEANLARDTALKMQAEANMERDRAQAENAAVESRRYRQLVAKGIAAAERYDQARTGSEALEAAVRADRAAIETAGEAIRADLAAIDNAKIQLGYCSIKSPLDGRTGSLVFHRGDIIKANDSSPLVVIHQVRPIYVSFSVPEQQLPDIRRYMATSRLKVEARITGDESRPLHGVLAFVDNAVNSNTGTIVLKGAFPNADGRLWPGQFVNVLLTLSVQPGAVVVPSEAIQTGQAGLFVFVVKQDDTVESRPIKPGRIVGSETIIETGLQPGERVVTDGQLRLLPGAKVQSKEPGQAK